MAEHAAPTGINMSNGLYDVVRILVEKVLPALGVFYYTIAHIWKLPHADEVTATFSAIAVLLAVVLTLSRKVYNGNTGPQEEPDGTLVVSEEGIHGAVLDTLPEDIANKQLVTFKVQNPQSYDAAN